MATEDIQNLQKQLNSLTAKVDRLDKNLNMIFEDLNVSRGVRVYDQLGEIINYLKILTRSLNEGQAGTLKYKIDNVMREVEMINKRI